MTPPETQTGAGGLQQRPAEVSRRGFLTQGAAAAAGLAALAAAMSPLRHLKEDDLPTV